MDLHDSGDELDLFQEPEGYYVENVKVPTAVEYRMLDGRVLNLRLAGQNVLWGHLLWNAGRIIAAHLESHAAELLTGKTVLEFGAGAGLPSLVAALHGARRVVVTDYPDADLIDNLRQNISACRDLFPDPESIVAEGYLWGADTSALTNALHARRENSLGGETVIRHDPADKTSTTPSEKHGTNPTDEIPETKEPQSTDEPDDGDRFDLLILADLLFNHSEHAKLVDSTRRTLRRRPDSQALVFFTPYRSWLFDRDMAFFDLAREAGFTVEKIWEKAVEKHMFEQDRGDDLLRRTVFGYRLTWADLGSHGSQT